MQMRPATVIAIVLVVIAMIVPVFFLDLDETAANRSSAPCDPPANAPHPHRPSPEMQRELDRLRRESKPAPRPDPPKESNMPPANNPNIAPPVD